jgi:hypothetical protein
MSIFQQPIERKLSALLGAEVCLERLKLSLLGGSLEAFGVTVGGGPVISVGRVRAEISVAKALAKQMVIKSLTIEKPVVSIVRRADGSWNLPKRAAADENAIAEKGISPISGGRADINQGEPLMSAARGSVAGASGKESSKDSSDETSWQLEARRICISDGEIHFRDETGGANYHASLEQIRGEVRQESGELVFEIVAPSVGRRDQPMNLGPIRLLGTFKGVSDVAKIFAAGVDASVELSSFLQAKIASPSAASGQFHAKFSGAIDLPLARGMVPPMVTLPALLLSAALSGVVKIAGEMDFDRKMGARLKDFSLSAADLIVPLKL